MDKTIHRGKRLFAGFLLTLFCSYMAGITCFVHSHVVDGQLITHSHPYRGTPDNPGHSHTGSQFLLIELLSFIEMLSAASAGLIHVYFDRITVRKLSCVFVCGQMRIHPHALRAPPLPCPCITL
ncbi:MAG: hypothetical protein LBK58_00810 [Prevotellaceae bacterium]|nr:hypothetical protein [Prevotellaceae bacterium]